MKYSKDHSESLEVRRANVTAFIHRLAVPGGWLYYDFARDGTAVFGPFIGDLTVEIKE